MYEKLGKKFVDTVTGFEGTATGYVQYLTGCNQLLLAPKVDEKGSHRESCWFDEQRCSECPADPVKLDNGRNPGCDKAAPKN